MKIICASFQVKHNPYEDFTISDQYSVVGILCREGIQKHLGILPYTDFTLTVSTKPMLGQEIKIEVTKFLDIYFINGGCLGSGTGKYFSKIFELTPGECSVWVNICY